MVSSYQQQTEQVLDVSKLRKFQGDLIDDFSFALDCVLFRLKQRRKTPLQLQRMHLPQLQFAFEGVFVNERENVCVPLFNEQMVAAELLFQPLLIGVRQQSLDEVLTKFVKQSGQTRVVLTGGGAHVKGITDRIREETDRLNVGGKKVEVENRAGREWEDLCIVAREMEW